MKEVNSYDDYLMLLHHMEVNHKEEIESITKERMDEIIRSAASNMKRENLSIGESKEVIEEFIKDALDKNESE